MVVVRPRARHSERLSLSHGTSMRASTPEIGAAREAVPTWRFAGHLLRNGVEARRWLGRTASPACR